MLSFKVPEIQDMVENTIQETVESTTGSQGYFFNGTFFVELNNAVQVLDMSEALERLGFKIQLSKAGAEYAVDFVV